MGTARGLAVRVCWLQAGWARSAGQAGVSVEVSSEADTRVAWHGTRWWCTPLVTAREVSSR